MLQLRPVCKLIVLGVTALSPALLPDTQCLAADWPRFRGADGNASAPAADVPVTWSATENVVWKTALPGSGSSSPVTIQGRIYLTAYTGYGLNPDEPGDREDLNLHVICINHEDGQILWDKSFKAAEAEQQATRRVIDHGYATGTPVCDQNGVYSYFGVSGLVAYNHDGELLWRAETGTKTAGFGSAASPILYDNLVIINASIESGQVIAFDTATGNEVWRISDVQRSWTTPLIAKTDSGEDELIVSQKDVVRGFEPASGKQLWSCVGVLDYVVPCVVAHEGIAYVLGGRKNQSMAIRLGGRGDVTDTHKLWETNIGANVTSPVYHEGRLYWISDRGIVNCLDASSGKEIYRERAKTKERVYASTILAGDHLFLTTRENGVFVIGTGPDYHEVAHNVIDADDGLYNATPAVSGNNLLLRTNRHLYCLGNR